MLRPINPPGPTIPGISQAMLVEDGRLLLLSGHVPFDAEGKIAGADVAAQLELVFQNLAATLREAGTDFSAVARLTIYVCDFHPGLLPAIRQVRDRWVNVDKPPASALVGVAALFEPGVLVEVDAIAVVPARAA